MGAWEDEGYGMWGRLARGVTAVGNGRWRADYVARLAQPRGVLGHLAANAMLESNTDLVRAVVTALDLRDGQRVLEVGCGPGQGVDAAMDVADLVIHAVDPSGPMLRRVSRRHRRAVGRRRLHLHHATLLDLQLVVPLQAAWGVNVVYFMADRVANFTHLHDLLEPGGRLALGYTDHDALADDDFSRCFGTSHHPVTSDEVEADLRRAGFAGVVTVRHDPDRRITIASRPRDPSDGRAPTHRGTRGSALDLTAPERPEPSPTASS